MSDYALKLNDFTSINSGLDLAFANGALIETQAEPFGFFPNDSRFPVGTHYDYDVETKSAAFWSELQWHPSENLKIVAGLRGEAFKYQYDTNTTPGTFGRFLVTDDRTDNFSFVTPKLGISWQPSNNNFTVFANMARGARAPQASDIYRLQSQQQPGGAKVEYLDSIEIGLRYFNFDNRLNLEVAAYSMYKKNFFFRDANGLNVTNGKTKHIGVETNANFEIFSDVLTLSFHAAWSDQTYTFNHAVSNNHEVILSGNQIDTAPEWVSGGTLTWTPNEKLRFSLLVKHIGKYYTNPANTHTYPGHTTGHLDARYYWNDKTTLFLGIRNLTDKRYADRADFAFGSERYFPGEPLNATLGVKFAF